MANRFDKEKIKEYDNVVQTIMNNVFVERQRLGIYLLYNFKPTNGAQKLFFNVTAIAADINKEFIYLDMPIWSYLKFRHKFGKKRQNLRWWGPLKRRKIKEKDIAGAQEMMDFIRDAMSIKESLYEEINNEYYGWAE